MWVVTGDGDALSIGGNHLIHALRRNVNLKILLFNNRIYGLTKGQYSPTSELGKITKSTPMGSLDPPFNPLSLALGAEATFVARTIDSDRKHLQSRAAPAAEHQGTAFVEIYQNCNIFNDGAFELLKDADTRDDVTDPAGARPADRVRAGRRLVRRPRRGRRAAVAETAEVDAAESSCTTRTRHDPAYAFALSRLSGSDLRNTPMGVFRSVAGRRTTADDRAARPGRGAERAADLAALLAGGDTWTVASVECGGASPVRAVHRRTTPEPGVTASASRSCRRRCRW